MVWWCAIVGQEKDGRAEWIVFVGGRELVVLKRDAAGILCPSDLNSVTLLPCSTTSEFTPESHAGFLLHGHSL